MSDLQPAITKHSIQEFAKIFYNMKQGFVLQQVVYDKNNHLYDIIPIIANPTYEQIFNLKKEQVIGKKGRDILNGKIDENWYTTFEKTVKTNEPQVIEEYIEGLRKYLRIEIYPFNRDYFYLLIQDITRQKEAQKALQTTEARFRSIYENNIEAILLSVPAYGIFIGANHAACQLFRMTEEEIKATTKEQLVVMDERALAAFAERTRKGKATAELTFRRKNGSTFEGEATSSLFLDVDGTIKSSMIIRDITERKKAQEAQRESENRFRGLAQTLPVGVGVSSAEGVFVYTNPAYESILGYNHNELVGKKSDSVYLNAADRTVWLQAMKEGCDVRNYEIQLKKKDGTPIWVAINTSDITFDGKQAVIGTIQDITELKKTEEVLKENERLYRTIFDNSQDGFQLVEVIHDKNEKPIDIKILKVNTAYEQIIGVKACDIVGKTATFISPNCEPHWFEVPDRVTKTGQTEHIELFNQDINKWLDCYYFPFSRNIVGTLFRDITWRKNLEKGLQDKERLAAIGATAGMVGHDIRNPLQAIVGDVYLIKEELNSCLQCKTNEGVTESIDSIEKNIGYINKIIADLQDYSRNLKPELRQIDLYELVTMVFHDIAIPKEISVNIDIEDNLTLKADPTYLKRILSNLVINALQAMPDGGRLSFSGCTHEEVVLIIVEDSGSGIPEEVKPKLFTPMVTTKSKGQGFGLAVAKRFVEALNGTISFESQQGRGTKFVIELPSNNAINKPSPLF